MVKEFLLICFIAFICWLLLRKIIANDRKKALYISLLVMSIGIVVNIGYNFYRLFPETWLNTVGGDYRYGTFHGNMLTWSDKFMYGEEILIPIVRNRTVIIDENATYCKKFFQIYGNEIEDLKVSDEDRDIIISKVMQSDNLYNCEFEALALMGYTWDENMPEDLIEEFEDHKYPSIYIDMNSIKDSSNIKIIMSDDRSLYMIGC